MKQLGLAKAKIVDTPAVKRTEKDELQIDSEPALPRAEASFFRSATMRAAHMSVDRVDISEAAKSLSRTMKTPQPFHMQKLKRLGR